MAERKILKTVFKLRRGKAELWHSLNPVLEDGEPGFELDTGLLKIGNGEDAYNDLPYINKQMTVDGGSIQLIDGKLEIAGFADAEVGQIPLKDAENNLIWKDAITDAMPEEEILDILNE